MNAQTPATALVIEHEPSREVTPLTLLSQALSSGADPATLREFMQLQREYKRDQAKAAFDNAIAAAKAEIPVIIKNRVVDFTSTKGRTHYAHEDLAGIARTVDPILSRHGLSYRFRTSAEINQPVTVTCILSHRDGHSEENTLPGARDDSGNKNSLQQIGSTLTYLQRYTLKAALGLAASADDDGQASESPEAISEEQLAELEAFIDENDAEPSKILRKCRVESLEDIPARDFPGLMTSLRAWAAQQKAAAA